VVTYDVVVGVENQDLRLKPGMTANVSIIVAQRDQVLKVPNSALRFHPPRTTEGDAVPATGRPRSALPAERIVGRTLWRLGPSDDPEPVLVESGISDGLFTELTGGELKEGDAVIVGLDSARAGRIQSLPPGFGGGSNRRPRSRERNP
ncbi:MAG TPA: hypothetical protein VGA17_13085, partial [Nitrospiraceae bacterium]